MRDAPIGGNIDCSEIAEYIKRNSDGEGGIINLTLHGKTTINIPESGGAQVEEYRYHDVYTDGRYVYDPAMSPNPVPAGDYLRGVRLNNPGSKLIVGKGGYAGPLW